MFHVHITAITNAYEKDLIYGLIQKGYAVAPASDLCVSLQYSEKGSALISLQLDKLSQVNVQEIYDDVISILGWIQAKYYSVIVTPFSYDARWTGSNFEVEPQVKESKNLN